MDIQNGFGKFLTITRGYYLNQIIFRVNNSIITCNSHPLDRGDGTCYFYDQQTKLCTIYATRPDICRVDKQYQLNYKDKYSWLEFIEINIIACKILNSEKSQN